MAKQEKKVKDKQRAKVKAKKAEKEIKKYKAEVEDESVLFICTECGENEEIPMGVVMHYDIIDDGDIAEPPTFTCEKCGGIMRPRYYEGVHGITYEYKN